MAFWRKNRFGADETVIALKDKKNNGFNVGYFNVGNTVYKITTSTNVKKEGVSEWATITKTTFRGGNNSGWNGGNYGR